MYKYITQSFRFYSWLSLSFLKYLAWPWGQNQMLIARLSSHYLLYWWRNDGDTVIFAVTGPHSSCRPWVRRATLSTSFPPGCCIAAPPEMAISGKELNRVPTSDSGGRSYKDPFPSAQIRFCSENEERVIRYPTRVNIMNVLLIPMGIAPWEVLSPISWLVPLHHIIRSTRDKDLPLLRSGLNVGLLLYLRLSTFFFLFYVNNYYYFFFTILYSRVFRPLVFVWSIGESC